MSFILNTTSDNQIIVCKMQNGSYAAFTEPINGICYRSQFDSNPNSFGNAELNILATEAETDSIASQIYTLVK